ncbi:TetR/AcrR family transcriptional regulator [Mesorhizobium sp. YM1C-6-2]|jgi:AcrR family transcriptional regulator|uniref:TetR/AcrR family transcriptional regulator n=1 Tax=Mesorhizobium sp. YM1C-6-2 TaxID=1827501 RepID=UPI000EF1F840|nr:TetR/AcrR family transcriptional regulator [Mesorhizobium sp. YM1C-6-2]RLP28157.1 TetR/AcrR family transcriptional regulator [Mesorhizobium sp. YM1C-6-2]
MVQVKKAEVRDAILEAATQLFFEKGYVGTSTNEIGQRAGVAPSAIYTYFDTKLDLFYQVYSPWLKSRLDRLEGELKAVDGHRAKVRRIVETIWRDIPNEQNFFANNLMQAVSTATPADHYSGELLEWCEQHVARMLKAAEPKPLHGLTHYVSLAHVLFMSFNGFVTGAYLGVRGDKTVPAIDAMTDLIVSAPSPDLKQVKG